MRNMRQWFSGAVMAALVQYLLGLSLFTSANGAPERAFEPQSAGPALRISDVSVNEGNSGTTDVLVAVTLTNPNGQTVTVDYQVVDGTAVRGSDYTVISTSGTMTFFNGGATTQRIRVTIIGDADDEPNETFFVNLSNATNATLTDNQAVGTIINDDGGGGAGPTLAIADASANEGNSGTTDVLVAVTLTNPNSQTVTVAYQVVDGSATAGSDYTVLSTSGTMTFFNGGVTMQRIRVTINGDATNEPDETFLVNLSNATNATLTDDQGVGTIINDDEVTPPAAPSNLNATVTGTTTALLAWADNSNDEVGFKIERKISGGNFIEINTVGSNVNSYTDAGLSAGTIYVYRVRAFKAALNSNYSNEATATTASSQPTAPSNLIATATGATTTSLAWTDNSSNESGFKIERKLSGGNFSEIVTVGGNVNSFNDAGLSAGTTYVYRVRAFNAALNSNYTNEAAVTTLASGTINLALNKPVVASSTSTSSFKPATNAVDGSALTYWRSASATNLTAWLRVDLGTPQPVGRVVVKWKSDYHALIYEIQVSNNDLSWTTVYSTSAGRPGVQELTFSPASARYVRIYMTKNNRGSYRILAFEVYSGASAAFAKQNESVADAPEIPNEFMLQQNYPNPFSPQGRGISDNPSTRISFNLPQASHVTIQVYSINGVQLAALVDAHYSAGTHSVVFKPKNLPSGTYFYVMQAGAVRKVRQLMLVK